MNDRLLYSKNKKALLKSIKKFTQAEQRQIRTAIELAEKYHHGQVRDEIEPEGAGYVIHCVRTALWLLQQGYADVDLIIAMILHDSLEDTKITQQKIENTFGGNVLKLVLSVTRSRGSNETEEDKKITKPKHFKKILQKDRNTRLLKTADILDNVRSWPYIPKNHSAQIKLPRWRNEAINFYIPIAKSVSTKAADEIKKILKNNNLKNKQHLNR